MRTSFGRSAEPRRSRIRCLGTVGRLNVGGRNRVGALGGVGVREIEPDVSDRSPSAAEYPIGTGVPASRDASSALVADAGNSSGTSAMVSPNGTSGSQSLTQCFGRAWAACRIDIQPEL